jgi:hypothetical protein
MEKEETQTGDDPSQSGSSTSPSPENIGNGDIVLGSLDVQATGVSKVDVVPPPDPSFEEATITQGEWQRRRFAQQDKMIDAMIKIFKWLNGGVMGFVFVAWAAGYLGKEEIITEHVVMSLIGATVIQAGIAFITITKFLFPSKGENKLTVTGFKALTGRMNLCKRI